MHKRPPPKEARKVTVSHFRIAQINILNAKEDLEERYRRLGQHLQVVKPTLVALQEVAEPDLLAAELQAAGFSYFASSSLHFNAFDAKADAVAIASKLPLEAVEEFSFDGDARPALIASVEDAPFPLRFATAHFTWGSPMEGVRLRQAEALTHLAQAYTQADPARRFVLAGDLNAEDDGRTVRYLQGLELGSDNLSSTCWTDAYSRCEDPTLWATSDQGHGSLGPATAARHGVIKPEFLPARRIDYIFSYGWLHGKVGGPEAYGRFGEPLVEEARELSDHYGIWADLITPPLAS